MLLACIDIAHHLLPNKVILVSLVMGVALLAVAAGLADDWHALFRALAGGALLFALYPVLALISPASMGMGDVKLAALIGVFLAFQAWETLLFGTLAGFVAGALMSAAVLW